MKYFLFLFLIFSAPAIATPCEAVGIAAAAIANARDTGESFFDVLRTIKEIPNVSEGDKSFYIELARLIYKNNIDAVTAYDIGAKACADILAATETEETAI